MIFIEFNGFPGCGKSTISEELALICLKNNIQCKLYDITPKGSPLKAKLSLVWRFLRSLGMSNFQFNLSVIKLLFYDWKADPANRAIKLLYIALMIIFNNDIRIESKKNIHQIIVIDQGLVQFIISTVYFNKFPPQKILLDIIKHFSGIKTNYMIVNCNLDIDIALKRLTARCKQAEGRFDRMDPAQAYSGLCLHKHYFEKLRAIIDPLVKAGINIDTSINSPAANALTIFKAIRE